MEKELTEVYCGNGKGKTALAIGQSLRVATQGKSVIVIQFLKGRDQRSLDFLQDVDNLDFKIFRFEKRECSYLGISKSSFYYKAKHGGIPVIKQGKHLFVYRDELDKWLETGRKSQMPLGFEEEHEQMLAATRHKAKPREL